MIEPSRLRKRIVAMHASLVVVIIVCAASALVALRTTLRHSEDRRVIDERLSRVERIRGDTREIALSARRYVLAGDLKEQQRVLAIAASMGSERERLRAASLRPEGVALDTGIDAYVQAMLSAMTAEEGDAIARLGHFEDELMRARKQLGQQFDLFVASERQRRGASHTMHVLTRAAQWGVLISGALGVILAIAAATGALRRLGSVAPRPTNLPAEPAVAPASAGDEPRVLT